VGFRPASLAYAVIQAPLPNQKGKKKKKSLDNRELVLVYLQQNCDCVRVCVCVSKTGSVVGRGIKCAVCQKSQTGEGWGEVTETTTTLVHEKVVRFCGKQKIDGGEY